MIERKIGRINKRKGIVFVCVRQRERKNEIQINKIKAKERRKDNHVQ